MDAAVAAPLVPGVLDDLADLERLLGPQETVARWRTELVGVLAEPADG